MVGGNPEPELVTTAKYQAFSANYRGVSVGRTTQHFDDQATETDFGFLYYVRADVVPVETSFQATFTLDSLLLIEGANGGVTEEQGDSASGAMFVANLAASGHLTDFTENGLSGRMSTEVADRVLKTFFPIIPNHGAEEGAVWIDTSDVQMIVNDLDNSVQFINEHTATEWTLHLGQRALHIITISNYSFNGSGSQAGRPFTLAGRGRRHFHRYLSENGRYLGLVSADTSEGEARLTDLEMVIPISQIRIDTLTIR